MLQLTDSPFWVGLAVGLRGACQTLFSVPAGAVADRVDRRRILLVATLLGAASVAAVAVLTLAGAVRPWHLLAFMGLKGLLSAVERPSSAGLLYDLVGPQRLLNASAFRFSVDSIKGWMTLEDISRVYQVPFPEILGQLKLPADTAPNTPLKELRDKIPGFEIGDLRDWLAERIDTKQAGLLRGPLTAAGRP